MHPLRAEPCFGLNVVTECPNVPSDILTPRSTWSDPAKYDETAAKLADLFQENFKAYADGVSAAVLAAGPQRANRQLVDESQLPVTPGIRGSQTWEKGQTGQTSLMPNPPADGNGINSGCAEQGKWDPVNHSSSVSTYNIKPPRCLRRPFLTSSRTPFFTLGPHLITTTVGLRFGGFSSNQAAISVVGKSLVKKLHLTIGLQLDDQVRFRDVTDPDFRLQIIDSVGALALFLR